MCNVTGKFNFHGVGQGLFYSGILENNGDTFSFVYDCGSITKGESLKQSIDNFKSTIKNNTIDLLVISHLHDDHVNGVHELLKDCSVKIVVMPYITIEMKLLALANSLGVASGNEILRKFYTDPVNWFREKKVNEIWMVRPKETEINEKNDEMCESENRNNTDEDSSCIVDTIRIGGDADVVNGNIEEFNGGIKAELEKYYWEFYFEVPTIEKQKVDKLRTYCDKNSINTCEKIIEVISDPIKRKKLHDNMKEAHKNLNDTSVILRHQPVDNKMNVIRISEVEIKKDKNYRMEIFERFSMSRKNAVTILTGDTTFSKYKKMKVVKYKFPFVLQIPHHGAKSNWYKADSYLEGDFSVITCGSKPRYGHPNKELIDKLRNPILITEKENFKYCLHIFR